jgi:hypothetical protein
VRLFPLVALAALLIGLWLVAIGSAAALVIVEEGKKPLWNEQTVSTSVMCIAAGAWLMVPGGRPPKPAGFPCSQANLLA